MTPLPFVFLVRPDEPAKERWADLWVRGVIEAAPTPTIETRYADLVEIAPDALYVLTRYPLFRAEVLDRFPVKSVLLVDHQSRSPYNIGHAVDVDSGIYRHPSVKAVIVTTPSMAEFHRTAYRMPWDIPVIAAGFPYPRIEAALFRNPHILMTQDVVSFPQRIADDTDPLFAFALAQGLMKRHLGVRFLTPGGTDPKWPLLQFAKAGIQVSDGGSAKEYRYALRQSAFAISTARGTTWLSGYESWLSGSYPIAMHGPYNFEDPFVLRYDPLRAIDEIMSIIDFARRGALLRDDVVDESWYIPQQWWERVLRGL